jgi:hypothetical protein
MSAFRKEKGADQVIAIGRLDLDDTAVPPAATTSLWGEARWGKIFRTSSVAVFALAAATP